MGRKLHAKGQVGACLNFSRVTLGPRRPQWSCQVLCPWCWKLFCWDFSQQNPLRRVAGIRIGPRRMVLAGPGRQKRSGVLSWESLRLDTTAEICRRAEASSLFSVSSYSGTLFFSRRPCWPPAGPSPPPKATASHRPHGLPLQAFGFALTLVVGRTWLQGTPVSPDLSTVTCFRRSVTGSSLDPLHSPSRLHFPAPPTIVQVPVSIIDPQSTHSSSASWPIAVRYNLDTWSGSGNTHRDRIGFPSDQMCEAQAPFLLFPLVAWNAHWSCAFSYTWSSRWRSSLKDDEIQTGKECVFLWKRNSSIWNFHKGKTLKLCCKTVVRKFEIQKEFCTLTALDVSLNFSFSKKPKLETRKFTKS